MINVFVFGLRGFPGVQGGVENHCENLYNIIAENKWIKLTIFRRKPYLTNTTKSYSKINFIDIPSTKLKGFEALYHSFLCTILCILKRPDIVHIHNIGPGLFIPLLKFLNIKVIVTYHSQNYKHNKWGFFSKRLLKFSEFLVYMFATRVIFVSRHLSENYSHENKIIITNAVKIDFQGIDVTFLSKYNIEENKYIFYAGRISKEKGVLLLINSFLELQHNFDLKLVIAGGIDNKTKYSKQVIAFKNKNDRIIFTNYIKGNELKSLYYYSKLFVLPSYYEGNPLALLEAMSYNLQIVVSNIPANRELNLNDDCYFNAGDLYDLTYKIERIIRNPIIYDFKKIIEEKYNWDTIAKKTLNVYKSLI